MKAYARIKLWEMCPDKQLFKTELEKIVSNTSSKEMFDVLIYCYEKYSDMHADVLYDVFSRYKNNSSNELTVLAESAAAAN